MGSIRGGLARAIVGLTCLALLATPVAAQSDSELRLRAAVARLDQGDPLTAILELEGVLARDPESWAAYYHLGRAQSQLGDDLGAKDSFVRAADLNPGLAQLHFVAAAVAYRLAHFDAAWAQLVAAAQAGYPSAEVQHLMKALRRYSEAPADLSARMAAPAVAVTVGDDVEDAAAVSSRVRSGLYQAPRIAVTLDEMRAAYRLELERAPSERGVASGLHATLVRIADGETLGQTFVGSTDDGQTMAVAALVARVEGWIGAPATAGIGR